MILAKADGTEWRVEGAAEKLRLRASLPGARVFDLAAEALRKAKASGVGVMDRLALALPASWCVNSPAPSTVLRRWTLPPQDEVWVALVDLFDDPSREPLDVESREAIELALRALGSEPYVVEAASKVLGLMVPDCVPLMPVAARRFVLGPGEREDARAFLSMVDWFAGAVREGGAELASWGASHDGVPITAPQVLDRLLWFDSEGHRHFPPVGGP
ncbi:MAG TPA: hypothetical protein VKU41_16620 [Polyangiaceae bacterium]|nr:hypothetical protein [Polyangiaceae bacterium]